MEQSSRLNTMMVTEARVRRTPENTTPPPGKTPAGREVQRKATAIQTSCQKTASNTSQRTARDCAVAAAPAPVRIARRADSTEESRVFAIKSNAHKPTAELRVMVNTSLEVLKKAKQTHGEKSLSFCLAVTKELDYLTSKIKADENSRRNYEFVMSQLGPQYACSLYPAMETLQSMADDKRSWEHYKDLVSVVKYLNLPQDKYTGEGFDKKQTWKLCEQFLHNEICYLEYIKDFPVVEVANKSFAIIDTLTNFLLKCPHCNFMPEDELENIKKKKNNLMHIIHSNGNKGSAGEYIQKMEKDLNAASADIQDKRRYTDLLRVRFQEIFKESKKKDACISKCFLMLKELCTLRKKHMHFTGEFHTVLHKMAASISYIGVQMLRQAIDNLVQLEKEVLDFMNDLMSDGLLNDICSRLYLRYSEAQAVMGTAVRTKGITSDQCTRQLDEIDKLAKQGTEDHAMKAAVMLRELLHGRMHDIKDMSTADELIRRIEDIKFMLFTQLFNPVLDKIEEYKPWINGFTEYNLEMSRDRNRLMQLSSYAFVIPDKKDGEKWHKSVCAAWYCDLERLLTKEAFEEEDIDCLLDLKQTEPDVVNSHIRVMLEETCKRIFMITLEKDDHDKKIPFHKLEMLHQWINKVATLQQISKQQYQQNKAELAKINEAWNRKYKDTTAGAASSDQPVSDAVLIQPEPEELSPSESKSSLTPPTKAPTGTISRPDVTYPESRADIEMGKSLAAGFSATLEQLAGATTTMATATAQVQQSTHSSLQDAGQTSSRTDKHVSRPTVTAPVKMMTADRKRGMTANRNFQETQEGITRPPKKTQTGRVVHDTKAAQVPGQIAVASSTSRQTISDDCAMATAKPITPETTRKAVNVEESRAFEIVECEYQPTAEFRLEVENSLKLLERMEKEPDANPLLFCRTVVMELNRLKKEFKMPDDAENDNYKFMECQLGPHYANSLHPALDILKSEINAQLGWKYYKDFTAMMEYFHLKTDETSRNTNRKSRKLLKDVYHLLIKNELQYWDYTTRFPLTGLGNYSGVILRHLLESDKRQFRGGYLLLVDQHEQSKIRMDMQRLTTTTKSHKAHGDVDEHIEKLEKKMRAGHADALDQRLYGSLLMRQIKFLRRKCYVDDATIPEIFLVIKEIYAHRDKCFTFLDRPDTVQDSFRKHMSSMVKHMMKHSTNHVTPWEKEVLDFIDNLITNNLLDDDSKKRYLTLKEEHADTKAISQTDKTTT